MGQEPKEIELVLEAACALTRMYAMSDGTYNGFCPAHKEKTASFIVSIPQGHFHCFGCGGHGESLNDFNQFLSGYVPMGPPPQMGPEAKLMNDLISKNKKLAIKILKKWFGKQGV